MSVKIRKITIENFRSIRKLSFSTSDLTLLVGKNDCGKSNILRALNLFFNDETSPNRPLNFEEDYCYYTPSIVKKAKEIKIILEIEPPDSYKHTNGDIITWEKRWRKDGLIDHGYYGVRFLQSPRGRMKNEQVKIPKNSNLHSLFKKIEFEYVPAIKDATYFDALRGRIYGIISEAATKTFNESSKDFESSIGDHLNDLTEEIQKSLGFKTKLALPRDLSHIFERLDFQSGDHNTSLEYRGDGIKARHIPLILKFMADKKSELQTTGSMPYSFIWAYEEPENNLEFSNAMSLAGQMLELVSNDVAQVILTTHSPAFYDLRKNENSREVVCGYVSKLSNESGTTVSDLSENVIDENMGTLAMFSVRFEELTKDIRLQLEYKEDALRLANDSSHKVFVEGESDQIIFKKALEVFYPQFAQNISFVTKNDGAGHTYVIDMLNCWRSQHKHHQEKPKAAGIVDGDAREDLKKWNNAEGNVKSAKCFTHEIPPLLRGEIHNNFNIAICLEHNYDISVWEWAKSRNKLDEVEPSTYCKKQLMDKLAKGEVLLADVLPENASMMLCNTFMLGQKVSVANYLTRKPVEELPTILKNFKPTIEKILIYFELNKV